MNWRAIDSADGAADALIELFQRRGAQHYEEAVTQTEHAIQTAELARAAGAPPTLVAAALLHDVGHLLEPEDRELMRARDLHHEELGARLLANWFGPAVTEPIRQHVPAKRYLCAVEAGYLAALSPASVHSLELQGGVMSAAEVARFEAMPGHAEAALLRRWDDLAKRTDVVSPPIGGFRELLAGLASVSARTCTTRRAASGHSPTS